MSRKNEIEQLFPKLCGTPWAIKSRKTRRYNCLAWAAREKHRRWDFTKGAYWPPGVKRLSGIAYLVGAYLAEGFSVSNQSACQSYDSTSDSIVLYERNLIGMHAARLLANGMWSSKLGDLEDVQHKTPEDISGTRYGNPIVYMKRKRV
ncbi:MAG: DUF7689 domain-containing protein [Pyrinomonadaceae bacterium]